MSAVQVIVGRLDNATAAGTRVYPLLLPQSPVFPAITVQQVSAVRTHAMGQDGPITRLRGQVNVWGKTYAQARELANEVAQRLSRFKGTQGGITVLDVLLDSELEQYEPETQTRRLIQDYTIFVHA